MIVHKYGYETEKQHILTLTNAILVTSGEEPIFDETFLRMSMNLGLNESHSIYSMSI